MKKLIFMLVMLPLMILAQKEYNGEFTIMLSNYGTSWDITFTLTAVGARWDENLYLTENYESVSDNIHNTHPLEIVACFDHILEPGLNLEYAIALYKVSAIVNESEQAYFYMDWRTSDWSAVLDVSCYYDMENNTFKSLDNMTSINYSVQTLWDLTNNILVTDGLEDYWDNCLTISNNGYNHPRLVWGPYPSNSLTINNYRIYRKYGASWQLLSTVSGNTFLYDDQSVYLINPGGEFGTTVQYKISAIYSSNLESSFTNIVSIDIQGNEIEKRSIKKIKSISKYQLEQNYPNPFNPTTVITWQSPIDDFVTLRVYDILGLEIFTLVNEYKKAGYNSVEFNASNLPSGIYFYKIQTGSYSESRKLLLTK